jgi:C4-dicarboxylate-specific signal transduction histidine kinase
VRELFEKRGDQRTIIHVDDVARQVLRSLEQELSLNEVSLATELQNALPAVYADRTQIQQVVSNLVRNAIDAMNSKPPRARRLRVATSLDGHSAVLLSVQDTGPGITTERSERVFEPFFTTKPTGMGLGLAICRAIVQDHGGNLRLAKTDLDGCIFEMTLPIAAREHGGGGRTVGQC